MCGGAIDLIKELTWAAHTQPGAETEKTRATEEYLIIVAVGMETRKINASYVYFTS